MINVLVTGGNGQLASCIKDVERQYDNLNFIYTDYLELDICKIADVNVFFESHKDIHYCINCAAYTAVDKAEAEIEKAFAINALGAKNLALACFKNKAILIHVSTDFVFDGKKSSPYKEDDPTNPNSIYGKSKQKGEEEIINTFGNYYIFRTAWLYSEHGTNFMKTMLRLAETRDEISVVSDQIGTPTYAGDLAVFIIKIILGNFKNYGIYHYSNEGVAGWYDFTKAIYNINGINVKVNPVKTEEYKQDAERPRYSVLDKSKTKNTFKIEIPYWRDSLKKTLKLIKL